MAPSEKDEGIKYAHVDTGTGMHTAAERGQVATDK